MGIATTTTYSLPGGGTTTNLATAQQAYRQGSTQTTTQGSQTSNAAAPAEGTTRTYVLPSGATTTSQSEAELYGASRGYIQYRDVPNQATPQQATFSLPGGGTTTNRAAAELAYEQQNRQMTRQDIFSGGIGRTANLSPQVVPTMASANNYIINNKAYSPQEAVKVYSQQIKKPVETGGTYTAAPVQFTQDPLTLSNLPEKLTMAGQRLESQRVESSDPYARFGLAAGAFAVGAGAAVVTPFLRPKETVIGTVEMVKHPIRTAQEIGTGLKTSPGFTAGQLGGSYLLGKAGGAVFEKTVGTNVPRVGYEEVKFPTATEEISVYRGLKIGEKPIVGISEGKVRFGEPSYTVPEGVVKSIKTGYAPETKLQTEFFKDIVQRKYPSIESEKLTSTIELIKSTEFTRSKDISALPAETKSLSPKGVQTVQEFIGKEGYQYGSFTAEAQLPKGTLAKARGITSGPVAGDIDVQFKISQEAAIGKTQLLAKKLSLVGENVRISEQTPTLIESFKGGQYVHAVDIHSLERPIDLGGTGEGGLGFKYGHTPQIVKTAQGATREVMPLSEFRTRKATSISQIGEQGLAPAAHRVKDIGDFIVSQEYLSKVAGKSSELPKLERLKEIYNIKPGEQISGKVMFGPSESKPIPSRSLSLPSLNIRSPSVSPSASLKLSLPSMPSLSVQSKPLSISPSISVPSISPSVKVSAPSSVQLKSPSLSPSLSASRSASLGSASLSPSISPALTLPSIPVLPSPSLPDLNYPDSGKGRREKTRRQKKKYVPSLTAVFANLKGRTRTKGLSGLEVRPFRR